MAQIQKKTSTMSLTISSCSRESSSYSSSSSSSTVHQQRHSSLVQPLCISPHPTQTTCQHSVNGGIAPTFVKCLHDVSTVKGQLVVLECRVRGTPPLNVSWYREDEQIPDSADFRILRKKASSTAVPEELCTLVITEAYPEDSGIFKCVTANEFGSATCSALLEVYTDLDEVLADGNALEMPGEQENFPSLLKDVAGIPPPEWPDSPVEETAPDLSTMPEFPLLSETTEKSHIYAKKNNSASQISVEAPDTPPTLTSPLKEFHNAIPKPFSPTSKLSHKSEPSGPSKTVADLPTFSPLLYPPSAFNYERPRHFIQSQPTFQAPSYDSLQSNGSSNASPYSSTLSSPTAVTVSSLSPPPAASHGTKRTSVTLIPRLSRSHCDNEASPAAFLASVLPTEPNLSAKSSTVSLPQTFSPRYSPTSPRSLPNNSQQALISPSQLLNNIPSSPTPPQMSPKPINTTPVPQQCSPISQSVNYKEMPKSQPKPILKKTVSQAVLHSTDEEIQGSKDALIQDLEKKLRSKVPHQKNNQQKLTYEERMARRLLGPANAASVFELEDSAEFQSKQICSQESQQTGGICSNKLLSGDATEGSSIQEKCYAPRFIQVPQDLTVEEGRFCRIDFKVGGLPTPDVTWYLDGKAIRPDDYHKMLVCEKGVHSFIIEIVTVHHAGVYECVARNRAGESRFSLHLDVIAQEMQHPPTFVVKMQNLRVLEGESVRLECKVAAAPSPQIYWKKDKEMLRMDPTRMSLSQDTSGRQCLLIDRVVKSDAGWYTVSAINEAGMSTCNARLDVATRLNKTAPPAKPQNMLPIINQFSSLGSESSPRHTAPLYESEEL
ncbi:myotilin isoform X1 [Electrophorus electricus]|uniref:myotilin isoform X1 n=1 Tax=Electrophorus electricus TaxID=8005 RepID=UPI0015D024CB|nr:myotilin isoform X1 [Electrophorus electricus]XP_035388009.1 myotilin isoform X1 [Electrophorus electricus]